jgi:hypothetical protein
LISRKTSSFRAARSAKSIGAFCPDPYRGSKTLLLAVTLPVGVAIAVAMGLTVAVAVTMVV